MAFDFDNKQQQGSGFQFGDEWGEESAVPCEDLPEDSWNGGFVSSFTTSADKPRNNLPSHAERTELYKPVKQRRRLRSVPVGGHKFRSGSSSNIPWRFLIIAALVIVVIALIVIYWDVILAFLAELLSAVITIVVIIFALRTLLRSR